MTDTLFEIEPTVPRWKELADLHGILIWPLEPKSELEGASAMAEIDWFGENHTEYESTEREAVITLIHRLQLEGWRSVSL